MIKLKISKHLILLWVSICVLSCQAVTADTGLHEAALRGDSAKVKALLDQGANVNAKNEYDETPLHLAEKNNYKDIMRLIEQKKPQ